MRYGALGPGKLPTNSPLDVFFELRVISEFLNLQILFLIIVLVAHV